MPRRIYRWSRLSVGNAEHRSIAMMSPPRNIAILGATGSIGTSTLDVIESSAGQLQAVALSAHGQLDKLTAIAQRLRPRWVVASDQALADQHDWTGLPDDATLLKGSESLERIAAHRDVDTVVAAIVGSAGLRSTWAALDAGKRVALANKETLVVAGPLVNALVKQSGAELIPVDSEHRAIFQALAAGRRQDVRRVILTASGGPFRGYSQQQLEAVQLADALRHPTWNMGRKISIDSATMMNKALEIIEARWLFELEPEQIDVVVHPQSIVHSIVEYADGSHVAQMSPPDMRLPIQYALTYPARWQLEGPRLDFTSSFALDFEPPDHERFPAIRLGLEVARAGGSAGAVVNAANEAAVGEFIEGRLRFVEIVPACRAILENHHFDPHPTLEQLFELDRWARGEVLKWACALR